MRRSVVSHRGKEAGFAEATRKLLSRLHLRSRNQPMNLASDEVKQIQITRVGLRKIDDSQGRIEQFSVFRHFIAIITETPNPASIVVPIDILSDEFRQTATPVNETTGDGTEIRVRMLDNGFEDRCGAVPAFRSERMRSLFDAPTIVSSRLNKIDHLPKVLSNLTGPKISRCEIKIHLPYLAQAISPDFRARLLPSHKGIIFRNCVGFAVLRPIDINPQNGCQ